MTFTVVEETPERRVLSAALAPGDAVFRGHFPEVALLPGVVQVDWAMAHQPWYSEDAFRRVDKLKFVQMTPPGIDITLNLNHREPGKVHFEYLSHGHPLSSGVLVFAEPGAGADP